jgi:hypothetical protein
MTTTSVNNDDWTGFVSKLNTSGSRLIYSTFLGGHFRSSANAITVDANGRAFVVGSTCSSTLPSTATAVIRTAPGGMSLDGCDGFLVQLSAAGSAVEYGTYIGGKKSDAVLAVALNPDGTAVYVAGYTNSPDFPVTTGALQPRLSGGRDGFLLVLDVASGRLLYSTYVGGASDEQISAVRARSDGKVILGGTTSSPEWPHVSFRRYGKSGRRDAFVLRVDTTGKTPASGVRIGGSSDDVLSGLDVDSGRNVYAVGSTISRDFPRIASGSRPQGQGTGFVIKLREADGTPHGWQVRWSKLLGGKGDDALLSVSAGMPEFLFISGRSGSTDFPVSPTAFHSRLEAQNDTTLVQLRSMNGQIVFSTFLGGTREQGASWYNDEATSVVATSAGDVFVTGCTLGGRLPVTSSAFQRQPKGNAEPFVLRLRSGMLSNSPGLK